MTDAPPETNDVAEVSTNLDRTTLTGALDWLEQDVRRGERLMRGMQRQAARDRLLLTETRNAVPNHRPLLTRLVGLRQNADRLRSQLVSQRGLPRRSDLPPQLSQMLPHGAYLADLPPVPEPKTAPLRYRPGKDDTPFRGTRRRWLGFGLAIVAAAVGCLIAYWLY